MTARAEVSAWVATKQGLWAVARQFDASLEHFVARYQAAALGDSLTDPYARYTGPRANSPYPYWGTNGDRNWVEQLQLARAGVTVTDVAQAGDTSADLLSQGQQTTTATLVHNGTVTDAVLMVGSNDLINYLTAVQQGSNPDTGPIVASLVNNLKQAIETIQAAGQVHLVVANIPDFTKTPQIKQALLGQSSLLNTVSNLVSTANQQIATLAAAENVPLVDLNGLLGLTQDTLTVGGTAVTQFWAADQFHPGTVLQGLLANAVLEADRLAYGGNDGALKLTDQEILDLAGIVHQSGLSYFDLTSYVKVAGPAQTTVTSIFGAAA